jgi:hypothetical protein
MNMQNSDRPFLVSVAFGEPYVTLQRRLSATCEKYDMPYRIWQKEPDGSRPHRKSPYGFKLYAIQQAIKEGHKKIIWADSAVYIVKDPNPFVELLKDNEVLFLIGGDRLFEYVNDKTLNEFNYTRTCIGTKKLELVSGSLFAFDFNSDLACRFFEDWLSFEKRGFFLPDGQQADGIFREHRNDEAVASLLLDFYGIRPLNAYEYFQGGGPNVMFRANKDVSDIRAHY